MNEKIKGWTEKAKEALSKTAVLVGDLNGDGKVDQEDAKIAAEWAKKQAITVGDEAGKLGREAMESDMVKDAAAGAAVGAAIAVPVPGIGPLFGAAVGAGVGVYKNITKKESCSPKLNKASELSKDIHSELLKYDDLRRRNIITEAEFEEHKQKLLKHS